MLVLPRKKENKYLLAMNENMEKKTKQNPFAARGFKDTVLVMFLHLLNKTFAGYGPGTAQP